MYRLFGRQGAGSLAPHLLLEELQLPYEVVWVAREEGRKPEFLKLNPSGTIPALILPDGKTTIGESAAIMLHLTLIKPSDLSPAPDSPEHARFLHWIAFAASAIYGDFLRFYYSDRYSISGEADAANVKARAAENLDRDFAIVEAALAPNLLGERLSAADLYVWMFTTWYDPNPDALYERCPKLGELAKRIEARPAAQKVLKENG